MRRPTLRWALAALLGAWVLAYPAFWTVAADPWGLALLLFPWLLGILMLASLVWVASLRPRGRN